MAPPKVASTTPMPTASAIAYDDAIKTLQHDRDMKRALKGVPLPLTFFCVFVGMLSLHIPTSALYEQGYSVSSVLNSAGTDAVTTETTMKYQNIGAISDVFEWLTDTFVPSVFVTEDYNRNLLTKDKWGRIANFNKVLGAVTFTTTRAAIHPCEAAKFLVDLYPNCYDAANVVTHMLFISFDTNATEATDVINRLKAQGNWLDFATQQLLISVVAYNGEVQGYTVTKLALEFHQGGYVETSATTTPTVSDPYKHHSALALDILVAICLAASLLQHAVAFLRVARSPRLWKSAFRRCDVWSLAASLAPAACTIAFYIIWLSMTRLMYDKTFRDNLARLVVSGKQFSANSNESQGLLAVTQSLERVAEMTTALRLVATAAVFALGIDILMQFRYHPRLNILTRTIANALHQFAGFFVVFVVIFVTFAVSGTILFGDRVQGFSKLTHTMESCVSMLFGNFDYDSIKDVEAPVGMLYYWAYMIVVSLVLLNMMLAIVLDSYEEMSADAATSKYNVSLSRTLRNLLYDRELRAAQFNAAHRIPYVDRKAADASRLDVVFHGRVIPDVLEAALLQSAGIRHEQLMTETTIMELFPGAKLSPHEASATIAFLLAGCRPETNVRDRTGPEEAQNPNTVAEGPASLVQETEAIGASSSSDVGRRLDALEQKLDQLLALMAAPK